MNRMNAEFEPTYGRLYNETFRQSYRDQRTQEEIDFVITQLRLRPGQTMLDAGCNRGRHAIALALQGYAVTGVDPETEAIELAQAQADEAGATVKFICAPMEDAHVAGFDAAICLGTSVGFHDTDEGDVNQLRAIYEALNEGGSFALECTTLLAQRYGEGTIREWWRDGDALILNEGSFDALKCRAHHTWQYLRAGEVRRREERYRVYAAPEMVALLQRVGFRVDAVYGDYQSSPFKVTSQTFIAICTKPD